MLTFPSEGRIPVKGVPDDAVTVVPEHLTVAVCAPRALAMRCCRQSELSDDVVILQTGLLVASSTAHGSVEKNPLGGAVAPLFGMKALTSADSEVVGAVTVIVPLVYAAESPPLSKVPAETVIV